MHDTAHQHQFENITIDGDTCAKQLRLVRRCTVCGYTEVIGSQENIIRHQFSERHDLKKPTCMNAGCASLTCVKCGQTKLVDLPLSDHHYIKNNPFYEICNDCHKRRLTSGAKRSFLVSGTAALTGSLLICALHAFSGKISGTSENDIEVPEFQSHSKVADTDISSETYTINSSQEAASIPQPTNDYSEEHRSTVSSAPAPSPAADAHISAPDATTHEQDVVPDFPEPETCPPAADVETSDTETTEFIETAENQIAASEITEFEVTEIPIIESQIRPSVTEIPSITALLEPSAELNTPIQEDYAYLIGTFLKKADILQLMNAGIPLQIMTDTGEKFCANTSVSGALPLSDTEVISETDLYTVNITLIEGHQVIVLNPL